MKPEYSTKIPITLPDSTVMDGRAPLVLIGPNGVGKTRFGTTLVQRFGYDRVPALRSLSFDTSIPYQKREDAKNQADQQINQGKSNPWQMGSELTSVLSELKAEDSQSAVEYRNKAAGGTVSEGPEVTRLQKLTRLWALIFPGRELDLSTYDPKVSWNHVDRESEPYSANQMSDGERGAMYLITRILRASPGVVIVDEPEVHFHSLLARAFWDIVEAERPDCRFIYITHDLPFALSRANARIGIVRSPTEVELVSEDVPIPPELYESILGAASLSVVARRIVFCEGKYDRSIDVHIYGAWFQSPRSVVVPVGSCNEVRQAVSVFKANPLIANAIPLGVVERDYWPESYLSKLSADGLHVLPGHEIESLLCLPAVAQAIAKHIALPNFSAAYATFEAEIRVLFTGIRLNKLILERAKRDADCRLIGLANPASPSQDLSDTRANFTTAIDLARAIPDVGALFDNHEADTITALAGSIEDVFRVVPGKDCFEILCRNLGVSQATFLNLVTQALNQPDINGDPTIETLRTELVIALTPHLPTRV